MKTKIIDNHIKSYIPKRDKERNYLYLAKAIPGRMRLIPKQTIFRLGLAITQIDTTYMQLQLASKEKSRVNILWKAGNR